MRYYVERQQWAHWPKTLVVVRDDGETVERKRYVPASDGPIDQSDAAEDHSWAEICAAKAEIGALTARTAELKAELDAKYGELEAEREESEFWKISHDSMKAMRIEAEKRLADSAVRIEELEAELEAEREESAFLDAECDRLSVAIADMQRTHMKLPLDADGVPIRPGDRMTQGEGPFTASVLFYPHLTSVTDDSGFAYAPIDITHANHDAVERIIAEVYHLVHEAEDERGLIARYAERVRKAVHDGD